MISSFIADIVQERQPSTSLDAGCGRWRYSSAPYAVLVDLILASFRPGDRAVVADLLELPFRDGQFDMVVCVGSVINYLDPESCINELSRLLPPGGSLVLEYERAGSGYPRASRRDVRRAKPEQVIYRGVTHNITRHYDAYIEALLEYASLQIRRRVSYHTLSRLVAWLTRNAANIETYHRIDTSAIARLLSSLASNAILECVKRP
jgi:SAM-dependent methyltransferase